MLYLISDAEMTLSSSIVCILLPLAVRMLTMVGGIVCASCCLAVSDHICDVLRMLLPSEAVASAVSGSRGSRVYGSSVSGPYPQHGQFLILFQLIGQDLVVVHVRPWVASET